MDIYSIFYCPIPLFSNYFVKIYTYLILKLYSYHLPVGLSHSSATTRPSQINKTTAVLPKVFQKNRKVKAAAISVISNSVLIILKVIAGILSGSVSIISEALIS